MILKIKLHWQILIALILAVAFGYYLPNQVPYISWLGVIFLRALNMIVVPLILSSIISGVASIGGGSNLGRLGAKTILFYVSFGSEVETIAMIKRSLNSGVLSANSIFIM